VLVLWAFENRLVFFPVTADQQWWNKPHRDVEDVSLTSADGTRIHAWWYPHPKGTGALLYLHGNAGNLSHRAAVIAELHAKLEESVLIIDYPGYGRSEGSPTEAGCYAAADAAYHWLTDEKKFPPRRIILYGESLGGAVAVDLASRYDHRTLVLVRSFTSAPDVARCHYPWLPAGLLMRNRFDSLAKLRNMPAERRRPVFIAHGTIDTIVPCQLSDTLYAAVHEPKFYLRMEGIEHNSTLPDEFFVHLKEFLRKECD
jgi:hypothetical protein